MLCTWMRRSRSSCGRTRRLTNCLHGLMSDARMRGQAATSHGEAFKCTRWYKYAPPHLKSILWPCSGLFFSEPKFGIPSPWKAVAGIYCTENSPRRVYLYTICHIVYNPNYRSSERKTNVLTTTLYAQLLIRTMGELFTTQYDTTEWLRRTVLLR